MVPTAAYHEAFQSLISTLQGHLPIGDLEDTLMDVIWNVRQEDDPNTRRLVGPVLLSLAEYDLGHRAKAEVFAVIDDQLRHQTIEIRQQPAKFTMELSSVNRTIKPVRTATATYAFA